MRLRFAEPVDGAAIAAMTGRIAQHAADKPWLVAERDNKLLGYAYAQPNDASNRLHRAMGFAEVGTFEAAGWKFGRWHDVRFYARTLGTLSDPEHDPLAPHAADPAIVRACGVHPAASRT
jgi:L-amino acid N-acyltransferase YncA